MENNNIKLICKILIQKNIDEIIDWKDLLNTGRAQNISSAILNNIKKNNYNLKNIPQDILNEFEKDYKNQVFTNLKLKSEIINIVKVFEKSDIPVILLKGSHLAFYIYESIGLRFLRDIDLIVPIEKSQEAYNLALNIGYKPDEEADESHFTFKYENHLPQLIKNNSVVLEIHGHLHKHSKSFNIPINYLWENAINEKIDKYNVSLLRPLDLLLHLIIHISYQDNFSLDLRHYYDIFLVLEKYKNIMDWDEVINTSEKFNIKKGVYIVLKVIEELFEYKFPEEFFKKFYLEPEKDMIQYAINIMSHYNRNSPDHNLYVKYRGLYQGYGDFFESTSTKKIIKITKKIFSPKEELVRKYGKEYTNKPVRLYIKNFNSLIQKNKFLFNKNDENAAKYIELSKEANKINNWILE